MEDTTQLGIGLRFIQALTLATRIMGLMLKNEVKMKITVLYILKELKHGKYKKGCSYE